MCNMYDRQSAEHRKYFNVHGKLTQCTHTQNTHAKLLDNNWTNAAKCRVGKTLEKIIIGLK